MPQTLSPALLLDAYAQGIFPMADSQFEQETFWVSPKMRGVFDIDGFHISRSLAKAIRRAPFAISFNTAFEDVIDACADRAVTWINATIRQSAIALHHIGHAHSVEIWEGPALVGGAYGVSLGGGFFAESMFSTRTNASKIALAYLFDRLGRCGFTLFDTQFLTPHLASLGAYEIPAETYKIRLNKALLQPASFDACTRIPTPQALLHRNAQMS